MTELTQTMQDAAVPVEPAAGVTLEAEAPKLPKPAGRWAVKIQYDPDDGFRQRDFEVPTEEYVKRYQAREAIRPERGEPVNPGFYGVVMDPVYERRRFSRWKPVALNSLAEARTYFTIGSGRRKRFIEQFGIDSFGINDPDFTTPGLSPTRLIDAGEFVPLLAGPFYKQLYIYDYLLMHARAFQLVNHNALAAAAVKIMTRFTLGRGLSFHIKDDEARRVWEEFWERNRVRDKARVMAWDLAWQGELLVRYYEPPGRRGYLSMRPLDASTCWEVVTDPEDVDEVYYYHFQWPTPYQVWVTGNIPVSKYIVQQVPPTNIQHLKLNVSAQERRGRSDLLPAMPWFKRFGDFYSGQTVKALLEANLVWKVKIKGDQADVDAFLSNPAFTELPPPGGMWIENEAVDLTAQSAVMTANRGSLGIGQQLASVIATSLNLPNEYFNIEAGAPSRATALVRTDPAVKSIEDRQQRLKETLEEMYDRVQTAALMAGRISRRAARAEPDTGPGEDGAPETLLPPGADEPVTRARLVRLR